MSNSILGQHKYELYSAHAKLRSLRQGFFDAVVGFTDVNVTRVSTRKWGITSIKSLKKWTSRRWTNASLLMATNSGFSPGNPRHGSRLLCIVTDNSKWTRFCKQLYRLFKSIVGLLSLTRMHNTTFIEILLIRSVCNHCSIPELRISTPLFFYCHCDMGYVRFISVWKRSGD